jgi:hypothetical protein
MDSYTTVRNAAYAARRKAISALRLYAGECENTAAIAAGPVANAWKESARQANEMATTLQQL